MLSRLEFSQVNNIACSDTSFRQQKYNCFEKKIYLDFVFASVRHGVASDAPRLFDDPLFCRFLTDLEEEAGYTFWLKKRYRRLGNNDNPEWYLQFFSLRFSKYHELEKVDDFCDEFLTLVKERAEALSLTNKKQVACLQSIKKTITSSRFTSEWISRLVKMYCLGKKKSAKEITDLLGILFLLPSGGDSRDVLRNLGIKYKG
ncbi:MAG: hypothetical protein K1000chlam4_00724, partial [Chlamydiae bacterium]|nr:hypothetical protein [Chlamydiota bacterium]